MTIYMAVTSDKYELPIAIADSGEELAKLLGVTRGSIYSYVSREKNGTSKRGKKAPFLVRKVDIK